jgi:hypothetical protein
MFHRNVSTHKSTLRHNPVCHHGHSVDLYSQVSGFNLSRIPAVLTEVLVNFPASPKE